MAITLPLFFALIADVLRRRFFCRAAAYFAFSLMLPLPLPLSPF